jgi:hypothetical protein
MAAGKGGMPFQLRAPPTTYARRILRRWYIFGTPRGSEKSAYYKPMAAQSITTKTSLNDLFKMWDSRASLYGRVMYCSAILRDGNCTWRNVLTSFQPLHRSERRNTDTKANYGDFSINQGLLSLGDAKTALTNVVENSKLSLPDQPTVPLIASLFPSSRIFWRGDSRSYPVFFPFYEYRFNLEQSSKAMPPSGPVWGPDLPLYPNGQVAIEDLVYIRLGDRSAYDGALSALVPDFRGKIAGIRLSNNEAAVQVTALEGSDVKDLMGKLYCEGPYGNRSTQDIDFDDNGLGSASIRGFPRQLLLALVSKGSHELIDERSFDAGSPYLPPDLTIEEVGPDTENLVRGGESDTIEFKSQIPQRQEAIAMTAVAFSNRKGGRILVGVENDGQIVGCPGANVKDTLTSILRDRCEPPVEFAIAEATVTGKMVYIVSVSEGKDKPYQVKEKGFYVRTGATNRLVTRYELDEMYRKNSGEPLSAYLG